MGLQTYVDLMARFTGREKEEVRKVVGRNKYWTPEDAIEFGIIDKIVRPGGQLAVDVKNYEAALKSQGGGRRGPVGAPGGADAA